MMTRGTHEVVTPSADVASLCSDLLRIDTFNPGGDERSAAEYVASALSDLGLSPELYEMSPRRTNVIARLEGSDRTRPAVLIHGHLDTVPATPEEWTYHPLSGEIVDGEIWGRGAVDMKNAIAMYLAAIGRMQARGETPIRDIVFAFVADEEAGGKLGAGYLVNEHPNLFDGCQMAVGEVGGFNVPSSLEAPVFAVSVADKGLRWYRISYDGTAGHGSMLPVDSAIVRLADAIGRIANRPASFTVQEPMKILASYVAGQQVSTSEGVSEVLGEKTAHLSRMFLSALQNTINPTILEAGVKENVVPRHANAILDCRFLPGEETLLHEQILETLPYGMSIDIIRHSPATQSEYNGYWFNHLKSTITTVVPNAHVAPYIFSGGTDNKWFSTLGMETFGFTPMLLPETYDFPGMFHGIDERVPIRALEFGVDVIYQLLKQ